MKVWILRKLHVLRAFARKTEGNVAIFTALTLPVLAVAIGGAMDYARALDARERLQTAVDSALLATASHRMANPDLTDEELQEYFRKQMEIARERRLSGRMKLDLDSLSFALSGNSLKASISGTISTTFLTLIGMGTLPVSVSAETQAGYARLEVALVLDTTGSMSWTGANGKVKIDELKEAARSFVNTLVERFGSSDPERVKIALVPFSQHVNVGTKYRNASWLEFEPTSKKALRKLKKHGIEWEGCVGSRPAPYNTRDDSYALNKIPIVMNYPRNTYYSASKPRGYWRAYEYYDDGKDLYYNYCPSPIQPLTSAITDKDKIIAAIDAMVANGWTYIPAGLMWGWRVLSPGEPFTEGADDATVKAENVRKIIILMTDGANTRAPVNYTGWAWKDHQEANPARADDFTRKACDAIKATNPNTGRPNAEIITVTFDVSDENIKQLMRECASIGSYDAKVGELEKLFNQIAEQISDLYLSG